MPASDRRFIDVLGCEEPGCLGPLPLCDPLLREEPGCMRTSACCQTNHDDCVDSRANTALTSFWRTWNGMNQYQKYDHAARSTPVRSVAVCASRHRTRHDRQGHRSQQVTTRHYGLYAVPYATPLSTKTSRRKGPPCDTTRLTPCHTMTPSPTRTRRAPKWNTSGGAPLPLVPLVAKDAGEGAHETLLLW